MKLNHDLVRELLLEIEENKRLGEALTPHNFSDNKIFINYEFDDVMYTLLKLNEAGYINFKAIWASDRVVEYLINDITYTGHDFLDKIRGDIVWEETKKSASKLGSVSLPVLSNIASAYINGQLGLS